ncbi:hypothetical protein MUS1_00945 [Marinomonas ushuaiensis DSM 15871]|uniref:Holin n=1 Tax=Marinomonas ushuaiensis DSM 15871 TaxID=1122207 RepID=X7E8L9_9GAMM|nr:hypothetical protein [Marinomonas ushuaiensis]ETX12205.1 hypothetical protein MUS1_00945 [Marinomonas ushuaiensis DSM 15871]
MPKFISQKAKPFIEGLAVGCVFISITMLFEIPLYMSFIIGALAALGGYRNSIKMDKEKAAKNAQNGPRDSE